MTDRQISIVKADQPEVDELKSFLLVVRRALLMVADYIERRYGIESKRR